MKKKRSKSFSARINSSRMLSQRETWSHLSLFQVAHFLLNYGEGLGDHVVVQPATHQLGLVGGLHGLRRGAEHGHRHCLSQPPGSTLQLWENHQTHADRSWGWICKTQPHEGYIKVLFASEFQIPITKGQNFFWKVGKSCSKEVGGNKTTCRVFDCLKLAPATRVSGFGRQGKMLQYGRLWNTLEAILE